MASGSRCTPVGELTVCSAHLCMITGCTLKYPECFGMGVDGIMCCIKTNSVCCKLLDERTNTEGKICICNEGGCFIVQPTTCCQQQNQCCCMDSRCAFPCTEQVPALCTCLPCCVIYPTFGCLKKVKDYKEVPVAACGEAKKLEQDLSDVPVGEVRIIEACCCSTCGIMCKYPECLGVKQEGICICCQGECSGCKKIDKENDDKICCICCDGGSYLVMPSTCMSVTETCFCFDYRCAFPCTEKVPCLCTCLPGCVVMAKWGLKFGCCAKVEDLIEEYKVPPAQVTM